MIHSFCLWGEMSLKIIRSISVHRGKNDKVDAERIAYYAMKNIEEAVVFNTRRTEINKIRYHLSLREKLVLTTTSLLSNVENLIV